MIIKRRVTRQFVQLENALVRDRRLDLDEHGMLHYLLSLPDDWEVNQAQCAKFWRIGRDKCRRIFRSLRKTGWAQLERLQSDAGEFIGVRWIIGDEPGAETSDDALAAEEATVEGSDAEVTAADHATENPSHGQPVARVNHATEKASHGRIKTPDENRDSTNTPMDAAREDEAIDDGEPPPLFAEVLRLWPGDNIVSPWACEKAYAPLSAQHKRDARDGVKPYLADCRSKGQTRLCDLKTYLYERRWEKFIGRGIRAGTSGYFVLKAGMPQTERWRNHLRENDPSRLRFFEERIRTGQIYTVPTEWPPPKNVAAA